MKSSSLKEVKNPQIYF